MDKELLSAIGELIAPMSEHLSKIDNRLGTIDKRLDTMDKRLDTMDKRLDTMDKRLDTMDKRLDDLEKGQKALEEDVRHTRILFESTEKKISLVMESQQSVIRKLDDMATVKPTVADNKDRIDTLETVAKSHSQRIRKLEEAVG